MLLSDVGRVLTFGNGLYGRLGHGNTHPQLLPRVVTAFDELNDRVVLVVAGAEHTLALGDSGALYSWGNGQCGRLGHGNEEDVYTPTQIQALHRATVTNVSAGGGHTLVTTRSGRVFSCGLGEFGQLGLGDYEDAMVPTRVVALSSVKVVQTSCGSQHSCFLTSEGDVYTCGKGSRGRLGVGDSAKRATPELVKALQGVVVPDPDPEARQRLTRHVTYVI